MAPGENSIFFAIIIQQEGGGRSVVGRSHVCVHIATCVCSIGLHIKTYLPTDRPPPLRSQQPAEKRQKQPAQLLHQLFYLHDAFFSFVFFLLRSSLN